MENTKAKGNLFMNNEKSKAKLVAQGPIDMEEGKRNFALIKMDWDDESSIDVYQKIGKLYDNNDRKGNLKQDTNPLAPRYTSTVNTVDGKKRISALINTPKDGGNKYVGVTIEDAIGTMYKKEEEQKPKEQEEWKKEAQEIGESPFS